MSENSNCTSVVVRTERGLSISGTRKTLYQVMDYVAAGWPPKLIRDFRREMNGIARAVVDFVKKYHMYEFDEYTRRSFLKEYAAVGGLLAQRIQREESNLYPLYQPV